MRFGFAIPAYGENADGGRIRELLVAADELGLDSAWFPDHVALPDYAADMLPPPVLEPLAACAWGLGLTNRLRFGTDVLVAPYRHPLVVAAMTGTLGRLAVDRLILGVGIGYLRGEFDALGVGPYESRARVTEEFLRIQRTSPEGFSVVAPSHRCRSGSAATARPPCSGRRCSATGGTRCGCPTGRTRGSHADPRHAEGGRSHRGVHLLLQLQRHADPFREPTRVAAAPGSGSQGLGVPLCPRAVGRRRRPTPSRRYPGPGDRRPPASRGRRSRACHPTFWFNGRPPSRALCRGDSTCIRLRFNPCCARCGS